MLMHIHIFEQFIILSFKSQSHNGSSNGAKSQSLVSIVLTAAASAYQTFMAQKEGCWAPNGIMLWEQAVR